MDIVYIILGIGAIGIFFIMRVVNKCLDFEINPSIEDLADMEERRKIKEIFDEANKRYKDTLNKLNDVPPL